jgi:hypothetical protein
MTPIATVQALVDLAEAVSSQFDVTAPTLELNPGQAARALAAGRALLAQMQPSEQVAEALTEAELKACLRLAVRAFVVKNGLRLKGQQ